jgi:hypothetical protein
VPLTAIDVAVVTACSAAPVAVVELIKLARYSRRGARTSS